MRLDFGSLAFNINVNGKVGGTPSWGTAIVYQTQDNKIKEDVAKDILMGMIYKQIDCTSHNLSIPLGKGGHIYFGDEDYRTNGAPSVPYLAAKFEKTYVNGKYVGKPFILLVIKDGYNAHDGRLQLKYSPKASWNSYKNQVFFDEVFNVLGMNSSAPLVCYAIDVVNQDELHFRCAYKENEYQFKDAKDYNDFINQAISKDDFAKFEAFTHIHNEALQTILYGCPGSGKSHKVNKYLEERGVAEMFQIRTTFHPDTDYASFVGCYKPSMKDGNIEYNYSAQVFTEAYVKAWKNPEESVYLIIEEINRGNCAQIFGDLFQLLDRDKNTGISQYPIKADKDLADYLRSDDILGVGHEGIKDGKLRLPSNLIIYATMNTSDQSLFPMDSAFKRRWDWEYVPIDYSANKDSFHFTIKIGDAEYSWIEFLQNVNDKITKVTHSEDKQMGNYFIKKSISQEEFVNKVMFYIWNEVCKEEWNTDGNFFRRKDNKEFKFTDLFTTEAEAILNEFMVETIGIQKIGEEDK